MKITTEEKIELIRSESKTLYNKWMDEIEALQNKKVYGDDDGWTAIDVYLTAAKHFFDQMSKVIQETGNKTDHITVKDAQEKGRN
jgi:hypothetical protein